MLFVSNGAQLLEKKVEIARKRMFLFSDSTPKPTDKSSFSDMWDKINTSLSFCASVDADKNMLCVRGAGWSGNKLFYNYVPNVRKESTFDQTNQSRNTTAFNLFCRYYAIGKDDTGGGALNGSGSLLDTLGTSNPTVPAYSDMVLPSFDNTSYSVSLYTTPSANANTTLSESGTIYGGGGSGIGYWSRNTTSYLQNIGVNSMDRVADTAVLVTASQSLPGITANQPYNHGAYSFARAPRLFQPYRSVVYGTTYFSGGGWSYTTSYSPGSYGTAPANENLVYYGQGTHEDTPAYFITWGAMPIAFAYGAPVYVLVAKAGIDFDVASAILPNEKPVAALRDYTPLAIERSFRC
ncbi:hypothetical protein MPK67_gp091 [Erwinia phage pEa_SNUABM_32]|uniref:Uncharacterized protein n=1 Tax=Erwinia phage pEa_SNUABM_32 TaxID=2869555 RepID=A0AAE8BZ42_9CAUD|nr:hypothetical protein MPK67_gp091 [Erwinia phage pEa_SNUABM_32]QZE56627.1 hypothetical protein pEaSNUABM20_00091 [Erwinia phage pEa_SNUABM_20]QZE56964.1 hypothetical protein pEaSNUABM32_00091 [Erwinia phage pEa_SNUABM_32]